MRIIQRFRDWLGGRPAPVAPAPIPVSVPVDTMGRAQPVRMDRMRAQLILHEAVRRLRYRDSEGIWTIGIGRNLGTKGFSPAEKLVIGDRDLDRVGLTEAEIEMLFVNDVVEVVEFLDRRFGWWRQMSEVRRRVLLDMAFNLGETRLALFVNTLAAMRGGRWGEAADGMAASKWAGQTKTRAERLIRMMRTDQDWPS